MNYYKKYLKYKKKYLELIGGGKNKAENIYYSNIINNFSEFKRILIDIPEIDISEIDISEIDNYIESNKKNMSKDRLFNDFPILERILRIIESKIEQINELKIMDESQTDKVNKIRDNSNIYDIVMKYLINGSLSIKNIDKFVEYYEDFKLLRENNHNKILKIEKVNLNDFNNLIELINFNQLNEPILQKKLSELVGGGYETIRKLYYNTIVDSKKYKRFYTSLSKKIDLENSLPTPNDLETHKTIFKNSVTFTIKDEIKIVKETKPINKEKLKLLEKEEKNIINNEMNRFVDTILPTLFDGIFEKLFSLIKDRIPEIFLDKAIILYLSGNLKTNDISNSIENLEIFKRNAELFKNLENYDINVQDKEINIDIDYFETFNDFESFIISKYSVLEDIKNKRDIALKLEKGKTEIEVVLDNEKVKVIKPLSLNASKFWGLNTKWCTAAKNNNMFLEYYKQGDIYIVISNVDNSKYQLLFEDGQFMDSEDRPIIVDELVKKINDRGFTNLIRDITENYKFVVNNSTYLERLEDVKSLKIGILYVFREDDKIQPYVESLYITGELTIPLDELLKQPSKLKRLNIGTLKTNIKPNILPNSLLFLSMRVADNVLKLEKDVLPENLYYLELEDYKNELKINDLPNNLKKLILINLGVNSFEPNILPDNLEELKLRLELGSEIIKINNLPKNLKKLSLHNYIIDNTEVTILPDNLKSLELIKTTFQFKLGELPKNLKSLYIKSNERQINYENLPSNLKELMILQRLPYNEIPERTLPYKLEKLHLRRYVYNIKPYILPDNLKILKLYDSIYKKIENDSLPLNLVELYLGNYNIELSELFKLKNLKFLEINNIEIKENDLPEGIETLQFCMNYNYNININFLPKTVTKIIVNENYPLNIIKDPTRKVEISKYLE